MQTYTHGLSGLLMGTILFPNNIWGQIVCMTGAIAPDLYLAPKLVIDKLAGRRPFTQRSKNFMTAVEVFNSVPLALFFLYLMGLLAIPYLFFFFLSYMLHLVVDALTHSLQNDASYLWPWKRKFSIAIWEYRFNDGKNIFKPKFPEAMLSIALAATVVAAQIVL